MSQATMSLPDAFDVSEDVGVGEDSQLIKRWWEEAAAHYRSGAATHQPESLEQRFQILAATWRAERGPTSSVTEMAMHYAYQQIIGMGAQAIPLILRDLAEQPDHWFWALRSITRVRLITPEQRGNVQAMAAAWIRWGKEEGYTW